MFSRGYSFNFLPIVEVAVARSRLCHDQNPIPFPRVSEGMSSEQLAISFQNPAHMSHIRQKSSNPRYSTTDHWIQESIKQIFNSGLFWVVEAAVKKNPNGHKYATLRSVF